MQEGKTSTDLQKDERTWHVPETVPGPDVQGHRHWREEGQENAAGPGGKGFERCLS